MSSTKSKASFLWGGIKSEYSDNADYFLNKVAFLIFLFWRYRNYFFFVEQHIKTSSFRLRPSFCLLHQKGLLMKGREKQALVRKILRLQDWLRDFFLLAWRGKEELEISLSADILQNLLVKLSFEWSRRDLREATLFKNYSKCRIWIFVFWHFPPIFVLLKLICLVTLYDSKFQVCFLKTRQNGPFLVIFN